MKRDSNKKDKVNDTPKSKILSEIIRSMPKEGKKISYKIPLSLDNTQRFIDPLTDPCCPPSPMPTCCCPCNFAESIWGLSKYLIVEHNYTTEGVRESALEWMQFTHKDFYINEELKKRGISPEDVGRPSKIPNCWGGDCELSLEDGGCTGMEKLIE